MIQRKCIERTCRQRIPHTRTRCDKHETEWAVGRPDRTRRPYDRPEHKRWREAVRLRARNRCEACGKPNDPRRPHEADHVRAVVDGGAEFDPANGRLLCRDCHAKKTAGDRRARKMRLDWEEHHHGPAERAAYEIGTDADGGPVVG